MKIAVTWEPNDIYGGLRVTQGDPSGTQSIVTTCYRIGLTKYSLYRLKDGFELLGEVTKAEMADTLNKSLCLPLKEIL